MHVYTTGEQQTVTEAVALAMLDL